MTTTRLIGSAPNQVPRNRDLGTLAFQDSKAISSTGTLGFGLNSGVGGAVTQLTSRTTGVTLNNSTGAITLFSTTTTAGQTISFTITNNQVAINDVIILSQQTGSGIYFFSAKSAAGSFLLSVFTPTAVGSAEAPIINFAVIKGSAN
jgi:hypothetical protein